MPGRLIYLMGPSGAGKDTVLLGLAERLGERACLAPRLVTRAPTSTEPNAVAVSEAEFLALERSGGLAMAWRANGLAYGVRTDIDECLRADRDVLVNGSRAYLPEARRRYPTLVPVLLTVAADTLHRRLLARGREDDEQIRERLDRNARYAALADLSEEAGILALDNSGPARHAIGALYRHLNPTDSDAHAVDAIGHR